ncbi:MAG: hypothetical protein H0V59_05475 [Nocardioidaceae bacterium]|nr:hypothetical protein [Nocardioidaceae bacterium]
MSKRRVRPRGTRGSQRPPGGGSERVETHADGDWVVRPVSGSSSAKTYRCPGCQQLIAPVTPHVVAWPVQKALLSDAAVDERRHWHTPCWRRRR